MVSEYQSAPQEFGSEVVVLAELESSCHEWTRVLTTLLMVLRWATPEAVQVNVGRCLRLVHLAPVSVCPALSSHLSAVSVKNSLLCDEDGEKTQVHPSPEYF